VLARHQARAEGATLTARPASDGSIPHGTAFSRPGGTMTRAQAMPGVGPVLGARPGLGLGLGLGSGVNGRH
jgi:hypothetical protein